MKHHGGPSSGKRKLIATAALASIRYAAPAWAEAALAVVSNCRLLARAQGLAARGVASTFCSVSVEVASLLAGMVPIDLLLQEDVRCYRRAEAGAGAAAAGRRQERAQTILLWQRRWSASATTQGASRYIRWTHSILPEVEPWVTRGHGSVDFHLAQVLSGHGFFREYLNVKGLAMSSDCPHCLVERQVEVAETVEHVLFDCPRFADTRRTLLGHGGRHPVTASNLGEELLRSPQRWREISQACRLITTALQERWTMDSASTAAEVASVRAAEREAAHRQVVRRRQRRQRMSLSQPRQSLSVAIRDAPVAGVRQRFSGVGTRLRCRERRGAIVRAGTVVWTCLERRMRKASVGQPQQQQQDRVVRALERQRRWNLQQHRKAALARLKR
uniref:Putative reverse transcriptase n=1 Tax=Anopheles braziliensis TaxID=58242 RepID=A0A2M3ZKB8_9DIPT